MLELHGILKGKSNVSISFNCWKLTLCSAGIGSASQSSLSTVTDEHHYIKLCTLIARLWHHQRREWTDWAMQLSHNGLETDHRKPLTNQFGQALAQLFLFSGPEMYASSNARESSGYSAGPLLLKERQSAIISRWGFWKQSLSQLKESELLSNETKNCSRRS